MKKMVTTLVSSALLVSLVGCAGVSNQSVGVVTGGAIGGAVGSLFGSGSGKILAAVGGTVLGAVLGGAIGRNMDQVDQMNMNQAIQTGQPSNWQNPNTGDTYYVNPRPVYYNGNQPCRDFTTRAIIGGQTQTIYGHACRMADGTWQIVNN